jgi:hypothetical protein
MRTLTVLLVRVQREVKRLSRLAFLAGWRRRDDGLSRNPDAEFEAWWRERPEDQ